MVLSHLRKLNRRILMTGRHHGQARHLASTSVAASSSVAPMFSSSILTGSISRCIWILSSSVTGGASSSGCASSGADEGSSSSVSVCSETSVLVADDAVTSASSEELSSVMCSDSVWDSSPSCASVGSSVSSSVFPIQVAKSC